MVGKATWVAVALVAAAASAYGEAASLPDGYMPEAQSSAILAKTLHVELAPDLSGLTPAERATVGRLIEVGRIFQRLHERMLHDQAPRAYKDLVALDRRLGSPPATQNLITLFYLFKGPIARTLDNERVPFLPVRPRAPGGSVYPWGVSHDELEAWLSSHPDERRTILAPRTVVRRAEPDAIARDLAVLDRYPVLAVLHPGLRDHLQALAGAADGSAFYAVPYPVAYPKELTSAYDLLMDAGARLREDDPEFAEYLQNRARDLLSNDYESGDASWVTGRFHHLNAQIGSFEVYNDDLFGVKTYFGLNVLVRDDARTKALRRAIRGIQAFENSLPYEPEGYEGGNKKTVREDIPVGVYNVAADFGQSRGTNTATILPNDPEYARKYGRTILLRENIMLSPDLFAIRRDAFAAAVEKRYAGDLTVEGGFYRTLWHEIGHYLGPSQTRDGRNPGDALESMASVYEELKADLVSLFLADQLREGGYYSDAQVRSVYADGVRRVLLKNEPRSSQPYQTMELMQQNFYLEHGLLSFDRDSGRLAIHYDKYHDVVAKMLQRVLAIQYDGDPSAAREFVKRYTTWDDALQGRLAKVLTATETYRYAYVTYRALESGR